MSIVVEDFMSKLKKQTGKNQSVRNFTRQTRKIEKLSLNNPNTLGRYQVFPILSSVVDFPFISGKVKQIKVPRTMKDQATGEEIVRYDLGEDFSVETAVVVADLYRHNGEWKFNAIGSGFSGGLAALCANFGVDIG